MELEPLMPDIGISFMRLLTIYLVQILKWKKGTRLVQLVLSKVEQIEWEVVKDVKNIGKNRGGGLGSTDAEKQGRE